MNGPLLPAWQVAWLLTRLRLLRMANMFGAFRRRNKKRTGTASKKGSSLLLTGFLALVMAFAYGNMAHQAVIQLTRAVGDLDDSSDAIFGPALLHLLSVEMRLLTLSGVLMALASRELTHGDWDLEWLVTLPAETGTLLWSRIAERTVASAFGMLALWPTCTVLAWEAGFRFSAVPVGLMAALPLLALTAMARTLIDTGLRLHLAPSRLRHMQAAISLVSILLFYLSISPGMTAGTRFLLPIAQRIPDWICWTPPGLVLQALGSSSASEAATCVAMLLAEVVLLLMIGMRVLRALLARGVAAAGARESGRAKTSARHRAAQNSSRWTLASPVQRRELTLLSRDRNFLVQTMVLPVLIVGIQWMLNGRFESFAQIWANPKLVAAGIFGISAYGLALSAFQTLTAEGGALWLLYTFPRPIDAVLRDKARLWSVLALVYPAIGFACLLVFGPSPALNTMGLIGMVVLGVPIYSTIAVALGVFGCNPLATDARQRVRPTYLYLYMLLSSVYVYALYAPRWWQSLVFMVLSALLALALWQKARDQLPYLLDPTASPPARVSTADGLIAAMMFFVLQVLLLAMMRSSGIAVTGPQIVFAFAFAGGLTYFSVRYTQWRTKVREVPTIFGTGWQRALVTSVALGLAAAALGIAYLQIVNGLGLIEEAAEQARKAGAARIELWLMFPLGVLAAPLCEEFIFRGLIFGGLRRSMKWLPAAVASAAVFAIVHPPLSMLPVFALGLCAAWAYDRSRLLIAPMIVHAIYNAAVIGWQSWMLV